MEIISSGIQNGKIADIYGKFGTAFKNGMPTYSLPFQIEDAPHNTVSFAVILDDKDAIPVAGFIWIHWLIADLTRTHLPANASETMRDTFVQGQNSWGESCYGGMAPPNAPHTYDLTVYALDTELCLQEGFTVDELRQAMQGHILDVATLSGVYRNA